VPIGLGNQIGSAERAVDSRFPSNFKCPSSGWPLQIGSGVKDVFKLNSQDWDLEFPTGPSPSTCVATVEGRPRVPETQHEPNIWACDFFCVRTIWFQTLYVFFLVRQVNREILHTAVTPCSTAESTALQIIEGGA
jgi:hypothetical protein